LNASYKTTISGQSNFCPIWLFWLEISLFQTEDEAGNIPGSATVPVAVFGVSPDTSSFGLHGVSTSSN
jgi:hypothetical protein